jgi:hypothetical protein
VHRQCGEIFSEHGFEARAVAGSSVSSASGLAGGASGLFLCLVTQFVGAGLGTRGWGLGMEREERRQVAFRSRVAAWDGSEEEILMEVVGGTEKTVRMGR